MARPLRIEYPGAMYHLTSRGNARENIYLDDEDRKKFLSILADVIRKYHWLCHAYCLMDNHYHLMVETLAANLSLGMRQLNGIYTQYFNRRHKRPGHVFQGRFKGILVDKDAYLLELSRYVVLNPVRAHMVEQPHMWEWSSYLATAGIKQAPEFLVTDSIEGMFNKQKGKAQQAYRRFVREGMEQESPWNKLKAQILLGEDSFVQKLRDMLANKEKVKEIPRQQRYLTRLSLDAWFGSPRVKTMRERNEKIYEAHVQHGYTLKQIADHMKLHYSTVSKAVSQLNHNIKT